MIDCQTSKPVDLPAGREAQPLADWLRAHPGVEVICRDRSGAYADGARSGAPGAMQVADRFHLWQNLGKAVERVVARHRACLRAAAPQPNQPTPSPQPDQARPVGRFAERARRHHALVHDLVAQGHALRAIARQLGWGFHTVQRYARAQTWQELVDGKWQGHRPSKLDPFKPHLQQRFQQGVTNAAQLHREICAQGYTGSYALVRDWLEQYRRAPDPIAPAPPTVQQVTGWLTRHPDHLTEDEHLGAEGDPAAVPAAPSGCRARPGLRGDAHPSSRPAAPGMDRRHPQRRRPPAGAGLVCRRAGTRPLPRWCSRWSRNAPTSGASRSAMSRREGGLPVCWAAKASSSLSASR